MTASGDAAVIAAARERRFHAELAEVLGADLARFHDEEEVERPSRRASWFAAALVLLGVAVTLATALAAARARPTPVQQPAAWEPPPLPNTVVVPTAAHFPLVRADVRSVRMFCNETNRDFTPFAAHRDLLCVFVNGPGFDAEWAVDCFLPFAGLPKLEVLEVPLQPTMTAAHLRVLAKSSSLRSVTLNLRRPLGVDDVHALAEIPDLVSLSLVDGSLDAAAVRALSDVPKLASLTLAAVDVDEPAMLQLRGSHLLRSLGLHRMGRMPIAERLMSTPSIGTGLTPAIAAMLRELPIFESVELECCEVSAAAIAELPPALRSASVTRCPDVGADVFESLQRFARLQRLTMDDPWSGLWFGPAAQQALQEHGARAMPMYDAQAALLRRLAPSQFVYRTALPEALRETVPAVVSLADMFLERAGPDDVRAVAKLPKLERLALCSCSVEASDLECLKDVRSLRRVELQWSSLTKADVERVLPGVTIVVGPN